MSLDSGSMTGRWWGLAGLTACLVLAWWLQDWPELLGIAAGTGLLCVIAFAFRAPRSASWHDVSAPVRVERGSEASVEVAVTIDGPRRWVSAHAAGGDSRWVGSADSVLIWLIDTSRRGRYLVGPSSLEFGDPFGLRRRVLARRELSPVLVVPRVSAVPDISLAFSETEGALVERAGIEQFHSVREYATGDPMKLVHCRASERTGKLMVRRLVDTTTPTLLVVLDVSPRSYQASSSGFDDYSPQLFEAAVDLAASYAWQHAGADQQVVLTTTAAGTSLLDITLRNRSSALDWLALVEIGSDASLGSARIFEVLRRRHASNVVLVTGPHARTTSVERSWSSVARVTVARVTVERTT